MITRFDHAVIGTHDLDAASEAFDALGFTVRPGGRHPGMGTRNALIRFEHDYLELLEVEDRDIALQAGATRRALVEYLDRSGDGPAAFAVADDDLDTTASRLTASNMVFTGPAPGQRRRPDGTVLRWRSLVPEGISVARPWPFLIEWPGGSLSDAEAEADAGSEGTEDAADGGAERHTHGDANDGKPESDQEAASPHENGAVSVASLVVNAPQGLPTALYADGLGLSLQTPQNEGSTEPRSATIQLPGTQLRLEVVPEPGEAGLAEIGVRVRDLAMTQRLLERRGLRVALSDAGSLRIVDGHPATRAIRFVEAAQQGAAR